MNAAKLKKIALRQPFQPFGIRLSNGSQYFFKGPQEFGAPRDFHIIVYFGNNTLALIDTENIVEVFPK